MVHHNGEEKPEEAMGHPTQLHDRTQELDSDDSLKWEDFFGTSVDIASVLLDMYDTLAAKNKSNEVQHPKMATMHNEVRCHGPHLGRYQDKKRPLSTSSVSSSSSSSSSSLPRNDVKKSYLASIESLEDVEFNEDGGGKPQTSNNSSNTCQQTGKAKWCDPNLSHIDRVIHEIVDTERTYVRDLNQIIEGYLKNISSQKESKISEQNLIDLFSNIEDIYRFNSTFLEELEQCGLNPVAVARCFVKNSNGFVIYTQYCTNYPKTVSVLTDTMRNIETAEILKERQTALHHSLPLGSYLLKPVQRILKYHLLLQNIVKNSDKENEGYADIKNALSVMTGIAYHINDMKRKHEHAVRVQEIQSLLYGWEGKDLTTYGELVAEGSFRMYRAKALRHLFLFDKILLIAKKREEGILCYKTHIMCSNLMLIESIQGEPLCFHVIPFDNPRFQYTFQARNLEQKREWCLQLKRVILENYNAVIPSHARQLVMELGQNRQDNGSIEKSTTKRQLSAPEYLEKRKQERRKSEINLNRAFRLKKGVRKGSVLTPKVSPVVNRRDRDHHSGHDNTVEDSIGEKNLISQNIKDSREDESHYLKGDCFRSNDNEMPPNANESQCLRKNTENEAREDHTRYNWEMWNSFPGDTTDTENEDYSSKVNIYQLLQYHPPPSAFNKTKISNGDNNQTGEYVTFFFANSHATRVDESNLDLTDESYMSEEYDMNEPEEIFLSGNCVDGNLMVSKSVDMLSTCDATGEITSNCKVKVKNKKKSENCKSAENVQDRITASQRKRNNTENDSHTKLWKCNSALRRVQSFTGMAKAKVASLHHSFSFRQSMSVDSTPQKSFGTGSELPLKRPGDLNLPNSPQRLPSLEDLSPITPAAWLKLQHEHLAKSCKKCGSLPRSFQLNQENNSSTEKSFTSSSLPTSPSSNCQKPKMRIGVKSQYVEHRPHTIASDKPHCGEFSDEFEHYINQSCSRDFSENNYEEQSTTGCTNTPSVSMENVHNIHPEHKIYHQAASKYIALKNVFCNMSSKLAGLKATIAPHLSGDHNSCSNLSMNSECSLKHENCLNRSSSQSNMQSEHDISPKILTAKFVQSVAKAYTSVIKQHLKKHERKKDTVCVTSPKSLMLFHKQGSSAIGARMARPLESEYGSPNNYVPPHQAKSTKDSDLRPDSLFSESSHTTSSSDGDKTLTRDNVLLLKSGFKSLDEDHDDTPSETSDTSADSYYERTFEAIENVFTDEIFRDSAIYSDPEDADYTNGDPSFHDEPLTKKETETTKSKLEADTSETVHLELLCNRPVNRAIIDRLRILEANAKFRRNDIFGVSDEVKSIKCRNTDQENCSHVTQGYESESSEHSTSTVMESNGCHNQSPASNNIIKTQSRAKGWVKHVVDKFQNESYSG